MVVAVVPHDKLMEETDAVVQRILRCDQAAIESGQGDGARDHRPPAVRPIARRSDVGYALCGGNTTVMERSQQFFDKADRGRNGATATPLRRR